MPYRNKDIPNNNNRRLIDPSKRAEMQQRDQIRQAYYAKLEREKQGLPDDPIIVDSVETHEINNGDVFLTQGADIQIIETPIPVTESQVEVEPKEKAEPKYFTQLAKKGWYNVIGPAGTPVNATLLKLEAAEKKATRMNNGANR